MATIIEVQDSKMQHLSEYAEKVLKYGGKLMQCLEELEIGSKYNEYYGDMYRGGGIKYRGGDAKHHERERWDDYPNRYY